VIAAAVLDDHDNLVTHVRMLEARYRPPPVPARKTG
jgi:hypothetical protein